MSLMKHRYSAVAIALHWILAFAIIGMIALGWYMGDLPRTSAIRGDLYQLHKSIGVSILVLTVARILWRVMNKPPEEVPMEHTQALIAKAVHIGFYGLMILMPLTGWMLVSASTHGLPTIIYNTFSWPHLPILPNLTEETKHAIDPFLENAHSKLAWVAIVLLGLHVAGALKHQFIDKDGLMARMLPGIFGSTDGVAQPAKGVLVAFGGAAAFFAIIVGLGMFIGNADAKPAPNETPQQQAPVEIIPNWEINKEESTIGFSGIYNKKPFEGQFESWTAKINYDPDTMQAAQIEVIVDTASAKTGDTYSDKSLVGTDFFDVKTYPEARFAANGVFATDDGLELTAVLTLKGQDFPIRMPFTLDIADGSAVMNSSFALDRVSLGLGVENDPNAEWISQTIDMNVKIVASRLN